MNITPQLTEAIQKAAEELGDICCWSVEAREATKDLLTKHLSPAIEKLEQENLCAGHTAEEWRDKGLLVLGKLKQTESDLAKLKKDVAVAVRVLSGESPCNFGGGPRTVALDYLTGKADIKYNRE